MSRDRPLSPHLTVYRPQLTSMLSILHRATGVVLALGSVLLVLWLAAMAAGPVQYTRIHDWAGSILGRVALFVWSLCLIYHLLNGIRHLAWDIGFGFELKDLYRSGWAVLLVTVITTLLLWWIGYQVRGGV